MTKFYTCDRCKSTISPEVVFHLKVRNSFKAPYEASLCPRCQAKVKEIFEGDVKKVEPSGFPEIQKKILVLNRALELACTELSESQTESHYPFKWVCDSEDFKCDRRCEHKRGKFKGTLSFDDKDCWKSFFLQKAGEAND